MAPCPWSKRPYSFLYRLLQKIWTWTVVYWMSMCIFVHTSLCFKPHPHPMHQWCFCLAYYVLFFRWQSLTCNRYHVNLVAPPKTSSNKLFLTNIWQKFYSFKCNEHHGWKTWCDDSLYVKCQTHSLPRSQEHLWLEISQGKKGMLLHQLTVRNPVNPWLLHPIHSPIQSLTIQVIYIMYILYPFYLVQQHYCIASIYFPVFSSTYHYCWQ